MPPLALALINGLSLVITEAPHVAELISKAKDFITAMTGARLITAQEQDALHARVDAIAAAALAGEPMPAWTVEADPS